MDCGVKPGPLRRAEILESVIHRHNSERAADDGEERSVDSGRYAREASCARAGEQRRYSEAPFPEHREAARRRSSGARWH